MSLFDVHLGELMRGTDEDTFIAILARNSYAQLQAISDAYNELAGKTLLEVCESELSGDLLSAAKTICEQNLWFLSY